MALRGVCETHCIHKSKKVRSARFTNVLGGLFSQYRPLCASVQDTGRFQLIFAGILILVGAWYNDCTKTNGVDVNLQFLKKLPRCRDRGSFFYAIILAGASRQKRQIGG